MKRMCGNKVSKYLLSVRTYYSPRDVRYYWFLNYIGNKIDWIINR